MKTAPGPRGPRPKPRRAGGRGEGGASRGRRDGAQSWGFYRLRLGLKFCRNLTARAAAPAGLGDAAGACRGLLRSARVEKKVGGLDARPLGASVMRRRCMFVGGVEGAREGATPSGCGAVRGRGAALHPGSGRPVSRARVRPGAAGLRWGSCEPAQGCGPLAARRPDPRALSPAASGPRRSSRP